MRLLSVIPQHIDMGHRGGCAWLCGGSLGNKLSRPMEGEKGGHTWEMRCSHFDIASRRVRVMSHCGGSGERQSSARMQQSRAHVCIVLWFPPTQSPFARRFAAWCRAGRLGLTSAVVIHLRTSSKRGSRSLSFPPRTIPLFDLIRALNRSFDENLKIFGNRQLGFVGRARFPCTV